MLQRSLAIALLVGAIAPGALAGVVTFDPVVLEMWPGDTASLGITVTAEEIDTFDAVDILFETSGPTITGFTPHPDFVASCVFPPYAMPSPDNVAVGGLVAGGFFLTPVTDMYMGTLEIEFTEDLALGDFEIFVRPDSGISLLTHGLVDEPLMGSTPLLLLPEPATLALVGMGALGLLSRRR